MVTKTDHLNEKKGILTGYTEQILLLLDFAQFVVSFNHYNIGIVLLL